MGDGNGGFPPRPHVSKQVGRVRFVLPESFHVGDMVGGVKAALPGDEQLELVVADGKHDDGIDEEAVAGEKPAEPGLVFVAMAVVRDGGAAPRADIEDDGAVVLVKGKGAVLVANAYELV